MTLVDTRPRDPVAPPPAPALRLGLDAGALYVHGILLDPEGRVVARASRPHQGQVAATARAVLDALGHIERIEAAAVTGSQGAVVASALGLGRVDEAGATLAGIRGLLPAVREVMDAGGGSLSLLRLSAEGEFAGYQANALCAAGTGSFLDEQRERLGFSLAEVEALPVVADPPDVATRCAVFAKSDLIHRQQEGFGKPALWAGLCRGLARTMVGTLFRGRTPTPPLALVGGVARNPGVVRGLEAELGIPIHVPDHPETVTARGAALRGEALAGPLDVAALAHAEAPAAQAGARRPPLVMRRSQYPSFAVAEAWTDDHGTEVRVSRPPRDGRLRGTLGVDIGSTSTKLALVDDAGEVVLDLYRRTAGDPIGATKLLLVALRDVARRHGVPLEVTGVGTTGSGRKLVGAVVRADRVVNEITAHVAGAMHVDPRIDTIFEIGGQDAKYVHTVDGRLQDANMNYVCAAGTGSFVEELSRKLGFDLHTLGDELMGVAPPVTSDRCTVFMEQDARHLLQQGFTAREVMGAVVASVVQNYLTKVVGRRPRSRERVFFQGATARNKALVAAFENLLDVEVVVSPYCHVMGAWGVALITARELREAGTASRSLALDLVDREVHLESSRCTLCANRCAITEARVEGLPDRPSWGYLCGREPESAVVKEHRGFDGFRHRDRLWRRTGRVDLPREAPVVAMPRTLLAFTYAPLWRRFFGELGYRLQLSGPTTPEVIRASSDWVGADYCFPVKLAHGHARQLLEQAEQRRYAHVFLPYMVSEAEQPKTGRSWFCPYNIGLPAMIEAAARLRGVDPSRLLKATVDLRWDDEAAGRHLHEDLGVALDRDADAIARAWMRARASQRVFEAQCRAVGRRVLAEAQASGQPVVAVLGRPYNVYDAGGNLALPEKLARLGVSVVPMEFLPLDEEPLPPGLDRMFWNFGRRILEAASFVARTPGVHALGFTNFSCGPDSFIWSYVERVMGRKPMLVLELDEHGADAGYLTRLEAFADVLAHGGAQVAAPFRFKARGLGDSSTRDATLWIPPMQEASPVFAAAALRRHGFQARALPVEDMDAFLRGRARTRGGECLPCPATLGTYLASVERAGGDPAHHALFMPTAEGPCRFGQYCTLDRMLLEEEGWDPVRIISWSSTDSYDGLPLSARRDLWNGLVLGDLLFKMRSRVLPYEREPGRTEALFQDWTLRLEHAIEHREPLEPLVTAARDAFMAVPRDPAPKPLVGIVGEIYVRNNRFTNQDVVRAVEAAGGEAWLAPLSEWVLYIGWLDVKGLGNAQKGWKARLSARVRNSFLHRDEARWMRLASPLLDDRHEPPVESTVAAGARYVPVDFVGETILTLGRTVEFIHQGAALVVNCSPFGCMPGAMTSGVLQQVEAEYGVPVATLFYDGEGGGVNDRLATWLAHLRPREPGRMATVAEAEARAAR